MSFVSQEYIDTLIEADQVGVDYEFDSVPEGMDEIEEEYKTLLSDKERIDARIEEIKSRIIKMMKDKNATSIKTSGFSYSYIPACVKKSFDSTLFKKEQSDLYEHYMKETKSKEQIRISVRKPRTDSK